MANTVEARKFAQFILLVGDYILVSGSGTATIMSIGKNRVSRLTSTPQCMGPYAQESKVLLEAEDVPIEYTVDHATPSIMVVSSDVPTDADGRPNGTIYIQTA